MMKKRVLAPLLIVGSLNAPTHKYVSYDDKTKKIDTIYSNPVKEAIYRPLVKEDSQIIEKNFEINMISGPKIPEVKASNVEVMVDGSTYTCTLKGTQPPTCPTAPPPCPAPDPKCPCTPTQPPASADWGIANIKADQSKKISDGKSINVCVADTGVDKNHPALAGKIRNTISFVDATDARDGQGHGTHVVGTITGNDNNSSGKQISASNATVDMAKVLDDTGRGDLNGIARGIQWCGNQPGVKVTSFSLGADQSSEILARVLADNSNKGIVAFIACGNSNRNSCSWPAKYAQNIKNVWAVVSTSKTNGRSAFSQWDPQIVATSGQIIGAPGEMILSTWPGGGFRVLSGTSMATPLTASVYASMLAGSKTVFGWDPTLDPAVPRKLNALKSVQGASLKSVKKPKKAS